MSNDRAFTSASTSMGSAQLRWQDVGVLKEILDVPRGLLQQYVRAVDRVNLATAQTKAIEHLKERLIGSHIEAEVSVTDPPGMPGQSRTEVHICVLTAEPLSPEVRFKIHRIVAAASLRFGVDIRAGLLNRQEQRVGQ